MSYSDHSSKTEDQTTVWLDLQVLGTPAYRCYLLLIMLSRESVQITETCARQ